MLPEEIQQKMVSMEVARAEATALAETESEAC
eukprot:SAG31_NODE_7679_length_1619_cov_1.017763_1_plen_31_part_10